MKEMNVNPIGLATSPDLLKKVSAIKQQVKFLHGDLSAQARQTYVVSILKGLDDLSLSIEGEDQVVEPR